MLNHQTAANMGVKLLREKSDSIIATGSILVMGESSYISFEELLATATRKGTGKVIIDFSDCIYIDSRAIALLISANRRLKVSGRQLTIMNCNQEIKELLYTMQLNKIMEVV